MSKIIIQDKLNKKPEIKTIMLKIQNEIKDIVITKLSFNIKIKLIINFILKILFYNILY